MDHFENVMKQAVSIKTGQMLSKRVKFEAAPLYVKAGLYYIQKFENVRKQKIMQRLVACEHIKQKGTRLFKEGQYEQAAREYEQV